MFSKLMATWIIVLLGAVCGHTATISATYFIGEVSVLGQDASGADFARFAEGERVRLEITLDDGVADRSRNSNRGVFSDPLASLRLVGRTSGAVLDLSPGLRIRARANAQSLRLESIAETASAAAPLILRNPVDFLYDLPVFSNPNDLSVVLAQAPLAAGHSGRTTIAYWDADAGRQRLGLRITAVPLPATGLVLLGALGGLAFYRRCRA